MLCMAPVIGIYNSQGAHKECAVGHSHMRYQ